MVHAHNPFEDNFLLGQSALDKGDAELATRYWRICADHLPNDLPICRQLAHAFRAIGQLGKAASLVETTRQTVGNHPLLTADEASIALDQGQAALAAQIFCQLADQCESQGLPLEHRLSFLSNALMALEYTDQQNPDQKKELAQRWGQLATQWATQLVESAQIPAWAAKPDSASPIRVGFLSGDLCDHPVGFLLLPLLQHRNPDLWTPYVYDNGSRQDNTHRQLKTVTPVEQWRSVGDLGDAAAMRILLADHLDVLIDLSGHTGKTRLRLMAHRLAQKQISWLGYSGTTGLATIDGFILDSVLAKDAADQFCEPILRLNPSRFCFRPPFAPPLQPPPYLKNGFITFGCFNNTAKYSPELMAAWVQILQQTPGSHLILKWRTFADPHFRRQTLAHFTRQGISADRIELRDFSTHRQMLDEYNDIDIALDTHPFNGGYTSLEALWMGLPLITLAGDTPIARQSASFLIALGMTDWISASFDDYERIARLLAAQPQALTETRSNLRFKIIESPLYDADGFSKAFESLLF